MSGVEPDYSAHWDLDNQTPLNHGSFGATPREMLKLLAAREAAFNRDREKVLWYDLHPALIRARQAVAKFVGADAADLVLVDNITEGFNNILRCLKLEPGDEVLVTDHLYSPYIPPLHDFAKQQGFTVKTVAVPYPPKNEDELVSAILAGVTKNTKLAIIEHISSPTAIIFPVKKIVAELKARNVDCFVDGAHAPGQIPLDLNEIGAAYYSANNHKWLCAPVSSGFLHVRKDRQDDIVPIIASITGHRGLAFAERFAWQGTKDVMPRLLVPETIEFMGKLHPQGWPGIMARNHALAVQARALLARTLGIPAPYPDDMFGCMFTLPLGPLTFDAETEKLEAGKRFGIALERRTGLRAYAMLFNGQYLLRLSAHLYNKMKHYEELAEVLPGFLANLSSEIPARKKGT